MTSDNPSNPQQISFNGELVRKGTHLFALTIPGGYYFLDLSKSQMLTIMVSITLLMILIDISRIRQWAFWRNFAQQFWAPIIRKHEHDGDFTGATYILLSVCFTVALFAKPIAIAALAFIMVGDTFAALIGRRFGRHRFGNKSIEGSSACLVGTLLVAFITPQLAISVAVFGALVATVVEALPLKIDDNLSVPLISGLAMTILQKIILSM